MPRKTFQLSEENRRKLFSTLGFIVAILAVKGFFDTSLAYNDYKIVYGLGVQRIHYSEIIFYCWYFIYATLGGVGLVIGFYSTGAGSCFVRWGEFLVEKKRVTLPCIL
ncbi:MAG: hypothetical protein JXX29_17715, partial [Deltaproteobacteria bacterium]|nr:hypothetical protein [Deltaproteobacteria bacterium]